MASSAGTESETGKVTPSGNRWLLVGAGLLLQFSIGAVYAWSTFGQAF